jgi:hypothetical protein
MTSTADAPAKESMIQDLVIQIGTQQQTLQETLSQRRITKRRREMARCFVFAAILYRLDTLSRLLRWGDRPPDSYLVADLKQLLERVEKLIQAPEVNPPWWWRIFNRSDREPEYRHWRISHREAAWELVLELDCALLEVGDTDYLLSRLDQERQLDNDPEAKNRWSDFYDSEQLHTLQRELSGSKAAASDSSPSAPPRVRKQIVEMLARLLQSRSDSDRDYRTQETMRVVRLRWTGFILGGALLAGTLLYSILLFDSRGQRIQSIGLALVPAALGGTLSRIRILRDEPIVSRSGEQPRYRVAFIAQLLVSGSLGLLLLGLVPLEVLPGMQPAPQAAPNENPPLGQALWVGQNPFVFSLYAFLAGYSEPWTFNILQRALPSGGAI